MEPEPPIASPPSSKTSPLAIWSLVLGCLAVVLLIGCIGPLLAIPAVICGHMAHSRIKRSGGTLSGASLALAGMITGYVSLGLSLLLIPLMLAIAVPNFVKARQSAQTNMCINNLRMIDGAKETCVLEKKLTPETALTPADLNPYLRTPFPAIKCPAGGTYSINKIGEPPTCSVPGHKLPGP